MEGNEIRIKFGESGSHLISQAFGEAYFKRVVALVDKDETTLVILDLEGVETIAPKFAEACFAGLVAKYGPEIMKARTRYENASEGVLGNIQQSIADMLMHRSGQPIPESVAGKAGKAE